MQEKKGFTLIEILAVVTVIGLLASLSFVALNNVRERSNNSKRVSDIRQIQTTLESYFNADNKHKTTEVDFMNPIPKNLNLVNCSNLNPNHNIYNSTNGNTYTLKYCLKDSTEGIVSKVSQDINFY